MIHFTDLLGIWMFWKHPTCPFLGWHFTHFTQTSVPPTRQDRTWASLPWQEPSPLEALGGCNMDVFKWKTGWRSEDFELGSKELPLGTSLHEAYMIEYEFDIFGGDIITSIELMIISSIISFLRWKHSSKHWKLLAGSECNPTWVIIWPF